MGLRMNTEITRIDLKELDELDGLDELTQTAAKGKRAFGWRDVEFCSLIFGG